jgi:hypothetical protein
MSDDLNLDIPEIHFQDTIELDDDIDFSVADFSLVDEEEQTRIIKPKMVKKADAENTVRGSNSTAKRAKSRTKSAARGFKQSRGR